MPGASPHLVSTMCCVQRQVKGGITRWTLVPCLGSRLVAQAHLESHVDRSPSTTWQFRALIFLHVSTSISLPILSPSPRRTRQPTEANLPFSACRYHRAIITSVGNLRCTLHHATVSCSATAPRSTPPSLLPWTQLPVTPLTCRTRDPTNYATYHNKGPV